MREGSKSRCLTFTEIAKLVGENWKNLSHAEKEPFETQSRTAKDKYNQDLAVYKKGPEYKKYMVLRRSIPHIRKVPSATLVPWPLTFCQAPSTASPSCVTTSRVLTAGCLR